MSVGRSAARHGAARSGKCCHRVVSPRTIMDLRTVLGSVLHSAVSQELIDRNVAQLVQIPKQRRRRLVPWTSEEARRFLESARCSSDPLYAGYVLVLVLGLRKGEVLGGEREAAGETWQQTNETPLLVFTGRYGSLGLILVALGFVSGSCKTSTGPATPTPGSRTPPVASTALPREGHQPCRFPVRQCDPMRGRLLGRSSGRVAANGSPCASPVLVVGMVRPSPLLFHPTDQ
jgi:hypothetical protein